MLEPETDIVLISVPILELMLSDSRFAEFPFIKDPPRTRMRSAPPAVGCGGCKGQQKTIPPPQQAERPIDYIALKLQIYDATPEVKDRLKELLSCRLAVLQVKLVNGQLAKAEF